MRMMNKDLQKKPILNLNNWLKTPIGSYIRTWEQKHLDKLTADIFGFHAMQIGLPHINALHANRMPYRWLINTYIPKKKSKKQETAIVIIHNFSELPFSTQSLDLIILPHVLEFSENPHQILREVERVLIPGGQIIITGFNPASLWGIRQIYGQLIGARFLPEEESSEGELICLSRLKDWLKLLNMEVNRGHFGCYAPPCTTKKWLHRFAFMEKAGDRWWPYFGAIYIIQAIKRVQNMCLVGLIWNQKKINVSKGVPAAN